MTAPLIACAQGQQIGTITKAKLAGPSRHRSIQFGRSTTKDCMAIRRRTPGRALEEGSRHLQVQGWAASFTWQ